MPVAALEGEGWHGEHAPIGVYFARMEALGEVWVRKVIALR